MKKDVLEKEERILYVILAPILMVYMLLFALNCSSFFTGIMIVRLFRVGIILIPIYAWYFAVVFADPDNWEFEGNSGKFVLY